MDTKALRQKILDLAIRGKLVPQDPNDEPASVLLERIKAEKEKLIKEGKIKRNKNTSKTSDTPHYGNVPFEVPDGWKSVPVSELFCLNPKSEITNDTSVGFIPMACVDDGFSGNHQFEERIWKDVKKGYCHFQNGDIGIAKISPCFENLKSTIFQNLPNNYGAGTTELVILRPLNIYAKFYLYLFKSQWYISEGTKYFKGVVGQQRVHKGIFTDLQIPLPPLAEQYRIVAEIEKWFALIDQIEQSKADLQTTIKRTKSKILDLAIHGKLVPQDPNDEPAIEFLKRINPNFTPCDNGQYGKLPQGWCGCHIDDIASSSLGKTLDREKNIGEWKNYICALNVQWGYFELSTIKQFRLEEKKLNRYAVQKGDLLVCEGGDVGRAAIWDNDREFYYQNALHRIRFFDNISAKWFLYQFMYLKYKGTIDDICKGVTIKHFTQNILNSLCFYLPPIPEQHRIVAKIEEMFVQLDKIEVSLQE